MADIRLQFPIIRNSFPTQIRAQLAQEFPLVSKSTNRRLKVKFTFGFYLTGGHYHDFMYGFGFDPYGLEFRVGVNFYHKQKNSIFCMRVSPTYFFKSKNLLLPKSWKAFIGRYIELRRKVGYGFNIIKGWLK